MKVAMWETQRYENSIKLIVFQWKLFQIHSQEQETSDLKTIVALRDFLAKGTGGRILRVLESLDLKVQFNGISFDAIIDVIILTQ